jgi:hypothetical protein
MAQPDDDLIIVASEDTTLPIAGVSNKSDPREDTSREFVTTQGYDTQLLPVSELNYILNNLGLWIQYIVDEYEPEDSLLQTNNLSDVDDAETAFDNIKQSATTSYAGVVELATDDEVLQRSSSTLAITPSSLNQLEFTATGYSGSDNDIEVSEFLDQPNTIAFVDGSVWLFDDNGQTINEIDTDDGSILNYVDYDDVSLSSSKGFAEYGDNYITQDATVNSFIELDSSLAYVATHTILDDDGDSLSTSGVTYDGTYYYTVYYDSDSSTLEIHTYDSSLDPTGTTYDISYVLDVIGSTIILNIEYYNGNFYLFVFEEYLIVKLSSDFDENDVEYLYNDDMYIYLFDSAYNSDDGYNYVVGYEGSAIVLHKNYLDSDTGMVSLASGIETLIGTSSKKAVTPEGLTTYVEDKLLGYESSYQEYQSTDDSEDYYREIDTEYTNELGRPIMVSLYSGDSYSVIIEGTDSDGTSTDITIADSITGQFIFIVPDGTTYQVTDNTPTYWYEV